jgi:hypothetical protein
MQPQWTQQAFSSGQFAMTEKQEWSIAVSWGYVVEVYKGFISPLTLQRPARTFLSWYFENDKGTLFYQYLEVCQRLFTTISIASLCKNET